MSESEAVEISVQASEKNEADRLRKLEEIRLFIKAAAEKVHCFCKLTLIFVWPSQAATESKRASDLKSEEDKKVLNI